MINFNDHVKASTSRDVKVWNKAYDYRFKNCQGRISWLIDEFEEFSTRKSHESKFSNESVISIQRQTIQKQSNNYESLDFDQTAEAYDLKLISREYSDKMRGVIDV